jgi:CubicO group peptidase (beta-lactamase class C family)
MWQTTIDTLLAPYDAPGTPGLSVGVAQGGQLVYQKSIGLANLADRTPITFGTNFRLASLTKQFVALAILMLARTGQLDLDQSLASHFPAAPACWQPISLRHLLTHRSGLRDYETLLATDRTTQVQDAEVLAILRAQQQLSFHAGSQFSYSNSGYVLLGLVIEQCCGQPLASCLAELIFRPLGMHTTCLYAGEHAPIMRRAYGYSPVADGYLLTDQSITSATLGDGGIYSSIADLMQWYTALDRATLLDVGMLKEIFTPAEHTGTLPDQGYGYGWFLDVVQGQRRAYHDGTTIGFRNYVVRYPNAQITVVVLANAIDRPVAALASQIGELVVKFKQ